MPRPSEFRREKLQAALKEAGLPHTYQNFVVRYENKKGPEGQPYLISRRNSSGHRVYTTKEIKGIIKAAKDGWFNKEWYFPPLEERNI